MLLNIFLPRLDNFSVICIKMYRIHLILFRTYRSRVYDYFLKITNTTHSEYAN